MKMKARFLATVLFFIVHGAGYGQEARWFDGDTPLRLWRQGYSIEHKSPIYSESPSQQAARQVLTGRIIVQFRRIPADDELLLFSQRYSLSPLGKMNVGTLFYLFQGRDAESSLETANRIYLSGEVAAAYPDWLYLREQHP